MVYIFKINFENKYTFLQMINDNNNIDKTCTQENNAYTRNYDFVEICVVVIMLTNSFLWPKFERFYIILFVRDEN